MNLKLRSKRNFSPKRAFARWWTSFYLCLLVASLTLAPLRVSAADSWGAATPIQNELNNIVQNQGGLGAMAQINDSYRGSWAGTAGVSDPDTQAPVDPKAHFRIASESKLFVATVILQLQAEGKLSLDDTLDTFLMPGLVPNSDQITIRMLLNHTSGIYNYSDDPVINQQILNNPSRTWKPEELVQIAAQHSPTNVPGSPYGYSNTNYTLAAMIIENITGKYYGDVIAERILNPLELSGTSVPLSSDLPSPYMRGYGSIQHSGGPVEPYDVTYLNPTFLYGAGQMVSTAQDLNTFYAALFSGKVLAPAQMDLLRTVVSKDTNNLFKFYGLGVGRIELPCNVTVWGHAGSMPGYQGETYVSDNGQRVFTLLFTDAMSQNPNAYDDMLNAVFCTIPLVSVSNPADGPGYFAIGRLTHLFTRATNGHLTWSRQSQPGGSWLRTDMGGALASNPVAASDSYSHLRVFAQGSNNHLMEIDLSAATPSWIDSGVTISTAPTVVVTAAGQYNIFARAGDNSRIEYVVFNGTTWQHSLIPGVSGVWSNLAAYSNEPGKFNVFFRRNSDARLATAYTDSAGIWRSATLGTTQIASSVAAASFGPGDAEVYARGTTNHLLRVKYTPGSGWVWTDLGGTISGAPSVYAVQPGEVHVFAIGANQALYERTPSAWVSRGGALSATPSAFAMRSTSDLAQGGYVGHVIAPNADGYLYELRSANGTWGIWQRLTQL